MTVEIHFTRCERQILPLMRKGVALKIIADKTGRKIDAVNFHVAKIKRKIGAESYPHAVFLLNTSVTC